MASELCKSLLEHKDVRATMICLHLLYRGGKGARIPRIYDGPSAGLSTGLVMNNPERHC